MLYALLVGLNEYENPSYALSGCVNDVRDMAKLLKDNYNPFAVTTLINEQATKENILSQLKTHIKHLGKGDGLVFHFSGHGSQIRDDNGDEFDNLDEVLITYHCNDWGNVLKDDEIAECFKEIPTGAYVVFISDSCHSGSVDRDIQQKAKCIPFPKPVSNKPVYNKFKMGIGGLMNWVFPTEDNITIITSNQIFLSGCKDNQTSADACFNGKWNGALTRTLIDVLKANPQATWIDAHEMLIDGLKKGGFSQTPQLYGRQELLLGKPF